MSFSFKQQSSQWQQKFARRQNSGPLQRVLAWLILGFMLLAGAAILVFMLLLSWILIPILLFRNRAKIKAWQQRQQAAPGEASNQHANTVIEGEVLQKRED